MRKKTYPTDMSRERFEQIRPLLEQARMKPKPRTVDLYEVGCAARTRQGRNVSRTFLIMDAQSMKNTDTAAHKGYDAGKKVGLPR